RHFPLFLDRKISLIQNSDPRKFIFSLLSRIQSKNLVLLVLIKAQVRMILDRPIGKLTRSPYEPTLFRAFLAHEQHSGSLAPVGPWKFLLMNPSARKISAIRNRQTHGPVGLHNIDAARRDNPKIRISYHRKSTQHRNRKHQRERARVNCKKARTTKDFHSDLL